MKRKTRCWTRASRTTRRRTGWASGLQALQKELEGAAQPPAQAWYVVARYLEADGKLPEAVRAADKAIEIDPRSIPAWTLSAGCVNRRGAWVIRPLALRRLAEIDRRNRIEHLTGIARIEARLGRVEPALKAGRDLLAASPGSPENYEFFAQLCFKLGRPEEGLDALRRAVRQPGGERGDAQAGGGAGNPVSNRRSDRDVLADV